MLLNKDYKLISSLIILYEPNLNKIEECINSLSSQVNEIFIVDNSIKNHSNFFKKYKNINYLYAGKNLGIAAAQNLGISEIKKKNYKYVIFSDQDTIFKNSYALKMMNKYHELSYKYKIAALTPSFYNINNKTLYPAINRKGFFKVKNYNTSKDIIVTETISSGLFINLDVFDIVGKMNEKLFIDWVDYEWCWRAKKNGYCIIMIPSIIIYHQLGIQNNNIFFKNYPKHNKNRYYYIFRNGFYLIFYSKNIPFLWKINIFINLIKYFFGYLLIEKLDKNFVLTFFSSVKDSIFKKMGSNEIN